MIQFLGHSIHDAILYGSYARGDFTAESDIDILLTADLTQEQIASQRRAVSGVASTLSLDHDITVSVHVVPLAQFRRYADFKKVTFWRNFNRFGCYRSAANRAYYAIFHAMRAVLALDGVDMKHHSGIISEFRKRYIKTGALTPAVRTDLRAPDVREGSDYNDFFIVSKGGHRRAGAVGRDVFDGGSKLSSDKILSL